MADKNQTKDAYKPSWQQKQKKGYWIDRQVDRQIDR